MEDTYAITDLSSEDFTRIENEVLKNQSITTIVYKDTIHLPDDSWKIKRVGGIVCQKKDLERLVLEISITSEEDTYKDPYISFYVDLRYYISNHPSLRSLHLYITPAPSEEACCYMIGVLLFTSDMSLEEIYFPRGTIITQSVSQRITDVVKCTSSFRVFVGDKVYTPS